MQDQFVSQRGPFFFWGGELPAGGFHPSNVRSLAIGSFSYATIDAWLPILQRWDRPCRVVPRNTRQLWDAGNNLDSSGDDSSHEDCQEFIARLAWTGQLFDSGQSRCMRPFPVLSCE